MFRNSQNAKVYVDIRTRQCSQALREFTEMCVSREVVPCAPNVCPYNHDWERHLPRGIALKVVRSLVDLSKLENLKFLNRKIGNLEFDFNQSDLGLGYFRNSFRFLTLLFFRLRPCWNTVPEYRPYSGMNALSNLLLTVCFVVSVVRNCVQGMRYVTVDGLGRTCHVYYG